MSDKFTAKEIKDVSDATSLAEAGNGSRLRDLADEDRDFNHHTKIINAMLNANQIHLHDLELQPHTSDTPQHVNHLKLAQEQKTVDGQAYIKRTLSSDGRAIYNEIWNKSKHAWVDSGSCPHPTGIIPPFIKIN